MKVGKRGRVMGRSPAAATHSRGRARDRAGALAASFLTEDDPSVCITKLFLDPGLRRQLLPSGFVRFFDEVQQAMVGQRSLAHMTLAASHCEEALPNSAASSDQAKRDQMNVDLFPCPVPFSLQDAAPRKGRRRMRFMKERRVRCWTNIIILQLS